MKDGEKYYFDKHGNSVKHIWNAISFGTKEEALDFGNEHLIFGELNVEEVTKTEQVLDENKNERKEKDIQIKSDVNGNENIAEGNGEVKTEESKDENETKEEEKENKE